MVRVLPPVVLVRSHACEHVLLLHQHTEDESVTTWVMLKRRSTAIFDPVLLMDNTPTGEPSPDVQRPVELDRRPACVCVRTLDPSTEARVVWEHSSNTRTVTLTPVQSMEGGLHMVRGTNALCHVVVESLKGDERAPNLHLITEGMTVRGQLWKGNNVTPTSALSMGVSLSGQDSVNAQFHVAVER